jgi:magnesium transporter
MIKIFKTYEKEVRELEKHEDKTWIDMINPTKDELLKMSEEFDIDLDFLEAPLDEEESPRIEIESNLLFILVNLPSLEEDEDSREYDTIPLGIIIKEKRIITVCLKDSYILDDFRKGKVKNFNKHKLNRFLLQILFRMDKRYLLYLKQIDRMSNYIESKLHRSMKNKELIQLLALEKSLVYFSTSLKANEVVLEKLQKSSLVKMYPEDDDLLEDVIIENKQAIEMASIYSNILSGMMDAFASVISNNLNIVMKRLTLITIILTIPTMFASFYGMNVSLPFQNSVWAFPFVMIISLLTCIIATAVFVKKKMF